MTPLTEPVALGALNGAVTGLPQHAIHYGMTGVALVAFSALGFAHVRRPHEDKPAAAGHRGQRTPARPATERVIVPVALVSSAAAAGVHAAMGPPHFQEGALFGLFFAIAAGLQLTWAVLLVTRRDSTLLVAGALANVAVIAVWAVSRTMGLPFGLLPEAEAVGTWDLACVAWELVVVVSCCVLLRDTSRSRTRLAPWRDWHRSVRAYAGGSVLLIAALAFTGGGSIA